MVRIDFRSGCLQIFPGKEDDNSTEDQDSPTAYVEIRDGALYITPTMGNNISVREIVAADASRDRDYGHPARQKAVTEGRREAKRESEQRRNAHPNDFPAIEAALSSNILFTRLAKTQQIQVLSRMYEKEVNRGEVLIREGDSGADADEMYVVKSGHFEITKDVHGVQKRIVTKGPGDYFGELALMYSTPRAATLTALSNAVVWVLDRSTLRQILREVSAAQVEEIMRFLDSVPVLATLSRAERLRLADAMEELSYNPGESVIREGEKGELFYIIKEGEGVVTVSKGSVSGQRGAQQKVNHLYKADFFGERALFTSEPRTATVIASGTSPLICLTLKRNVFVEVLGPLQNLMVREKIDMDPSRPEKLEEPPKADAHQVSLKHLVELEKLGSGAFSVVYHVRDESTRREYALKKMRKTDLMGCSEHVFCEQHITRLIENPFVVKQYASFQDSKYLYLLLDYLPGGDLMDSLVACAEVKSMRVGMWCLSPKVDVLQGMKEPMCRFYIACLVSALEYLHGNSIVYRDLKPENVMLDRDGYIKLGDFGFAKVLSGIDRTYTFCGTPGYVAPESVLARGYGTGVDWWGLGVVMYVLLTGRQPFGEPTEDPMVVMNRIVDPTYEVYYPSFMSKNAINLIQRFLERKPAKRLGNLSGRAKDVKEHPWFAGLDWNALARKQLKPPPAAIRDRKSHGDLDDHLDDIEDDPQQLREAQRIFRDF